MTDYPPAELIMPKPTPITRPIYFLTATHTNAGKTTIAAAFLNRARLQHHGCVGLKPVSAGCIKNNQNDLISPDAEQLINASSIALHGDLVAPVKLAVAQSPHIAAKIAGVRLSAARIVRHIRGALSELHRQPEIRASLENQQFPHVIIEGTGGWLVPINERETMADIAKQLQYPVILVVNITLGCLNHALLTQQGIINDGLTLAGWVGNITQPQQDDHDTAYIDEQMSYLTQHLNAPCLGIVPYLPDATPDEYAALVRWPHECAPPK